MQYNWQQYEQAEFYWPICGREAVIVGAVYHQASTNPAP